jgi:hypothetical protein
MKVLHKILERLPQMQFKKVLQISGLGLGTAIVGLLACGEVRTWQVQRSPQQKRFLTGQIPRLAPKGFYKGSVPGLSDTPWQGKYFEDRTSSGINIFQNQMKSYRKYPFRTSIGTAAGDKQLKVFKIDYNNPANPWWVRMFLDEVVSLKSGQFLGKLSLELIPSHPYQITFFELKKDDTRFKKEPD